MYSCFMYVSPMSRMAHGNKETETETDFPRNQRMHNIENCKCLSLHLFLCKTDFLKIVNYCKQ